MDPRQPTDVPPMPRHWAPVQRDVVTERTTERTGPPLPPRKSALQIAQQVVDFLFFLLFSLFAIRFVLTLLGARERAGFVQFIHTLTDPFFAPFRDIVDSPHLGGGHVFSFPILIAVIAYAVLHAVIHRLFTLFRQRSAPRV